MENKQGCSYFPHGCMIAELYPLLVSFLVIRSFQTSVAVSAFCPSDYLYYSVHYLALLG